MIHTLNIVILSIYVFSFFPNFRTKVSHQDSLLAQLERERQENSELKNRLHRIESTYQSYINSETELVDINTRLKNEIDVVKEDLRNAKEEIGRNRNETEKVS